MNPFAMFIGFILLACSVFFVASPFRTTAQKKKPVVPLGAIKDTQERQRQAVLLALRDLDFDYQAGKVTEVDYQALRASLLSQAAQIVQREEHEKEDSIEEMIRSRRQARSTGPAIVEKTSGHPEAFCQHCHTPLKDGARFCSKCGKPAQQAACPKCKQALNPGDRFCPSCGTEIN